MRVAFWLLVGCTASEPRPAPKSPTPQSAPTVTVAPVEREPQTSPEWIETSTPEASPPDADAPARTLDAAAIRETVKRAMRSLNRCYEEHGDAELHGLSFTIGPDGHVTDARTSSARPTPLDNCMTSVLRRLVFPKPADGGSVTVSYPLH